MNEMLILSNNSRIQSHIALHFDTPTCPVARKHYANAGPHKHVLTQTHTHTQVKLCTFIYEFQPYFHLKIHNIVKTPCINPSNPPVKCSTKTSAVFLFRVPTDREGDPPD